MIYCRSEQLKVSGWVFGWVKRIHFLLKTNKQTNLYWCSSESICTKIRLITRRWCQENIGKGYQQQPLAGRTRLCFSINLRKSFSLKVKWKIRVVVTVLTVYFSILMGKKNLIILSLFSLWNLNELKLMVSSHLLPLQLNNYVFFTSFKQFKLILMSVSKD